MNAKILIVGAAAYLGIKLLSKKSAAEKLSYYVNKVSLRFSNWTPVLDVVIGVQNPTNTSINLGSILGDLYINNNYVANIAGYQLVPIAARSNTLYPISARLSVAGLIGEGKDIVNAISTGQYGAIINQTLKFKGYVNAEGLTMPLEFSYKVL
jgi:hypothetical protein